MNRTMRFLIGAVAGATIMLPVAAVPAAADGRADVGTMGYGGVTDNERRMYACDTSADGLVIRTYARLSNNQLVHVDDGNGSQTGCSGVFTGVIKRFQVCAMRGSQRVVCTDPRAA